MNLAYVCTNFNNSDDTVAAVQSIRQGDARECLIVVVDNQSRSDELEVLRDLARSDSRILLIENEINSGYFPGLNIGLQALYKHAPDTDAVIIGNNDLLFPPNLMAQMSKIESRLQSQPVISPCIVTKDGDHQNPHVLDRISWFREIVYDIYHLNYWFAIVIRHLTSRLGKLTRRGDEDHHTVAREIEQGHGSCYILGRRFFEDYGEFWAPTFLFGEESFLSLQLARNQERVFFDPSVQVIHAWHSSISNLPSRRLWELARDAHRVYRKHNPIKFGSAKLA